MADRNDRLNDHDVRMEQMNRERMGEIRATGGQGSGTYRGNMPMMRETMPAVYGDEFRQMYRDNRYDRANKMEKNIYKKEKNYKKYKSEDEVFECIIDHLTKGVKFHDKMMDLYGFLGLDGFKKMHEYHYYDESMNRRKAKCYVLEHMNFLVSDNSDEENLNFIPQSWYDYTRHEISSDARRQYIEPSFMGYKQWEEETKELLSYCANELMSMGKMSSFNEVMGMVDDVEEELKHLEELILKLQAVDFDAKHITDMQESICKEYEEKLEECFDKKIEEDKKKKRYKMMYGGDDERAYARRRSSRTGRYI